MEEEKKLARLFRFVAVMPLPNIVSMLFPKSNLLLINKEIWEEISDDDRRRVMRTEDKTLVITYRHNKAPLITPRSNNSDE